MTTNDPVNPQHYRNSGGVQLIELVRLLPFSIGNAIKYSYRNARKENAKQDLEKALWYLDDFARHPQWVDRSEFRISQKLLDSVFEGADDDDRASCEALVEVYLTVPDIEDFTVSVTAARDLLARRILSLEN